MLLLSADGSAQGDEALKVRVVRELCLGVSNCVAYAPTVFALDDERKAVVLDPHSVDDETLLQAAESCPEKAIIIEDDEGNISLTGGDCRTGRC